MVYIGDTPRTTSFASVVKDEFSGDGSETAFTLSKIATTNSVSVFVENVRQEPTTAYSVSGTTLTFTAAPVTSSGNNIYVLHMNPTATATHPSAQNLTAVDGTFTGNIDVDGTANLDVVDIDGAVDIASTTTLNDDVTFTGANYNVTWDKSANLLQFVDNAVLRIGTGNDLDIYHSSNVNTIKTQTDLPIKFIDAGAADMATLTPNGAVSLYHNGTAAITTASGGAVTVTNGITLSDGNVTVASGHGIDFSAQTAASAASASATGELFDRYEEGIFTHAGNSNMTINSVSARGFYTIIGDKCFINGFVRFTHSGSDNVTLSLPVASKGDITSPANGEQEASNITWFPSVNTSGDTQLVSMYVPSGSSSVTFYNLGTGSGVVTNNGCDSTAEFYYNLNYKIA